MRISLNPHIRRLSLPAITLLLAATLASTGLTEKQMPPTAELISELVTEAGTFIGEDGQPLLPADTAIDHIEWQDTVLHIDLTLPPAETPWHTTPVDLELLFDLLAQPFKSNENFAGLIIRARCSAEEPYLMLEEFKPLPLVQPETSETETGTAPPPPGVNNHHAEPLLGGPTANAGRQPNGALSGVTIYTIAGHGWTAGTSSWALQRNSDLLEMNEDYGNLDMVNYFVHYAFNAGATVVPFRPVGWQTIEIVLDNDDPGVTFTGGWGNSTTTSKYYENNVTNSGIPYKWIATSTTETAVARYTPNITVTDFYPVYCFTKADTDRVLQTYRISHSGGTTEVAVDHHEVGNGWIWLGEYYFEAGGDNFVEITNESPQSGVVIADAIRWGSGIGDVSRPGPGTVSGYPRDEEAARYWCHSELGNNAVNYDSDIWDIYSTDLSDNHGVGARWAREMNRVPAGGVHDDRWRRVYLSFHSNAAGCAGGPPCSARGSVGLITGSSTTNQEEFAALVSDELDLDMQIIDDEFEHNWVDRVYSTYTGSYGTISTTNNSNEFDATVIEVAFHDNQEDAELLRDCRVRAAVARSQIHAIIKFLGDTDLFPDTQVPLAFAPDTPRDVQVVDNGDGSVTLSWLAPLSDEARGDPATGYVIYESSNGYGFGNPTVVGNVETATLPAPAPGQIRYYRVAATNAGGESMPSEVLALRRAPTGIAEVLIVNGYDRLRRQQNYVMEFTFPPAYAGDTNERQIWRLSNSYDYVVQYVEALATTDHGCDSCTNEAVIDGRIQLTNYAIVLWICGEESTEDATLSSSEQTRLTTFLQNGGGLFISGAEIGFDLVEQGNGQTFYENTLGVNYVSDSANTYQASGTSLFADVGNFDFDPANGAPYDADFTDRIGPQPDGETVIAYQGGSGGNAGVIYEHAGGVYRVVTFGFPFEAITSATTRAALMERIILYLEGVIGPLPFDADKDGDVDWYDANLFLFCFQGADVTYPGGHFCLDEDGDGDDDVDLHDFTQFQTVYTGEIYP
ncbi:MAG: hypothetical protein ABIG44_01260 [Planctomycetota bacterium]